MNLELAIVVGLLAIAIAMFAVNKPRMDAVGLIMLTALPLTGVITMNEALAGFSDPNIVLLGALFVVGEGLVRTGVAQKLGDWLIRTAGSNENRLLALLMGVVGSLGAFMSSTGVVAIFIPVAQRIAKSTGTAASQLMMPLSVAALISGMMTLVATAPNLVVNSELVRNGSDGFGFFSFTPFGLPILILGVVYMLFARRWLSAEHSGGADRAPRSSLSDWIERYGLAEREYRVKVSNGSVLAGKELGEVDLGDTSGLNVVAVERRGRFSNEIFAPTKQTVLQVDDILLVDVSAAKEALTSACERFALEQLPLTGGYFSDRPQEIGMVEVMVSADSELIGKTVIASAFRSRHRLTVIGLRRGKKSPVGDILHEPLRIGDTLLLVGPWTEIQRLRASTADLVLLNLPAELDEVLPVAGRAPQAVFCLVVMVGLMVSGVVPNVQAALIACLVMGLLRCIDLDSSYRSIHWKSLILIVGMLPFSIALQKTGGVELAADALMALAGGAGDYAILGSLFAITAILGLFISNTATAVLMAPVALAIAGELQASPYPFAMIVALAASTAFMTPISSPVNTLVVAPGNYGFGDFIKVGVPFSILVMVISVFLVPLLLPLHP
ncbi:MAG TPA: SLC13 family permease [Terrimicrobiaceae bacterium]|nr:SLC13 family permease [Terrimicrobiaceae bacterium]